MKYVRYVTLGSKANSFMDPSTGIHLVPGEVRGLNHFQNQAPRIKRAIAGGHLVVAQAPVEAPMDPIPEVSLVDRFNTLMKEGAAPEKLAKAFKADELKEIAEAYSIEVEEGDTKEDIVNAILEEASESAE